MLDDVTLFWLTNTGVSAARLYWENKLGPAEPGAGRRPARGCRAGAGWTILRGFTGGRQQPQAVSGGSSDVSGAIDLNVSSSLAITFWLPVASLVAVEAYARNFDGWGAWATAPLFLVPLLLSLAIGAAGASRCISDLRAGRLGVSTAVFTGVAVLPVAWLFVRRHFF